MSDHRKPLPPKALSLEQFEAEDEYDYGPDDENDWCTHCGGEGWDNECHEEGCYCLEGHPCGACGGSGLAKDQTIW